MHSHDSPDIHPRTEPPERQGAELSKPEPRRASSWSNSDQLNVCFHCAGELVYPLDWSEEGLRHWRIVLRCPECESRREGVFEQSSVEMLDDELDRASSALLLRLLGVAKRREAERLEAGVAHASEDERQRHRSVQEVGPARLARALDRPRDVEHVVEHLEREPDASREVAESIGEHARAARGGERAQAARRLEQRRGLQLAAAQIT